MNLLPMRNILNKTRGEVQSFLTYIPKKLHHRFLFGMQAFGLSEFRSINSNGRITARNRSTGEMRAYRTSREARFLEIFPKFALQRVSAMTGRIRLSLDFSTFGSLQIAYMGIITGKGRTIPIWLQVHPGKPKKNSMIPKLIKGLKNFLDHIDDPSRVVIAADRWFASPRLLRYLDESKVKFVIRIRSNIGVEVPWDEDLQKIYEIAQDDCQITHAQLRLRLIVSKWDKKMKQEEPWFLITNDSSSTRQQIINIYKRRFEIEEMFKDMKWILDYEWQQIQKPEVLEIIMWFVTIGWWIMQDVLAVEVRKSRSRKINPHKRLSYFACIQERLVQSMWPPELRLCNL